MVENECAAYTLPSGVVAGDTDGCIDGIVLTTRVDSSCSVKCGVGLTGAATTVNCAADSDGEAATSSISCTGELLYPLLALHC